MAKEILVINYACQSYVLIILAKKDIIISSYEFDDMLFTAADIYAA